MNDLNNTNDVANNDTSNSNLKKKSKNIENNEFTFILLESAYGSSFSFKGNVFNEINTIYSLPKKLLTEFKGFMNSNKYKIVKE